MVHLSFVTRAGPHSNKGRKTYKENPNQESEKHSNSLLQSFGKKHFFTLYPARKTLQNVSRASANCDDSGPLNQKIAASAPFSPNEHTMIKAIFHIQSVL